MIDPLINAILNVPLKGKINVGSLENEVYIVKRICTKSCI
jgi:hypothetical protein